MTKYTGKQVRKSWPLVERLAFRTGPITPNGCVLWAASTNAHGYGVMRWERRNQLTHRLAWMAANGPIPDGMSVCHSCDTPACMNVGHLFLGTHQDNMRDCAMKGRAKSGQGTRHWAVTDGESVKTIRSDPRMGTVIAREYGVGSSLIYSIKARQKWAHCRSSVLIATAAPILRGLSISASTVGAPCRIGAANCHAGEDGLRLGLVLAHPRPRHAGIANLVGRVVLGLGIHVFRPSPRRVAGPEACESGPCRC